jgi:3-deoxy-D-manno-octulosonic-acid transferase
LSGNKLIYLAYQLISGAAGLLAWPYFYRHLKSRGRGESFLPRLGLRLPPSPPPPGSPRLWIHGVSVGEILAAIPLVEELKKLFPQASITITTGTETGQAVARQHFSPMGALVCYFPLDLPWAVNRYLKFLRPQLFMALESEIWPNFLTRAHRRGVLLALANGRLSDHSFRSFMKYKRYLAEIISYYDLVTAGSPGDYERFRQLGVPPERLHLAGNLKIDRLLKGLNSKGDKKLRAVLNLTDEPVWLAASTHPGEEEVVLEAYQRLRAPYPALLLILAPRHPERAAAVGRLLTSQGFSYHLWSELQAGRETRVHPVVVLDTIGDLFNLYGVATIAFVGGSLIPHGGQNILEAAAWGVVPLYGPHLDNFRWAEEILATAGVGITVTDADSLETVVRRLLEDPAMRESMGLKARESLSAHQGAAQRQARLLAALPGSR